MRKLRDQLVCLFAFQLDTVRQLGHKIIYWQNLSLDHFAYGDAA
jgi:hypothetical protein